MLINKKTFIFLSVMHIMIYLIFMHVENYIDGEEFFCLREDEVKEIVPVIGIAKKIFRLRQQMVCLKLHSYTIAIYPQ